MVKVFIMCGYPGSGKREFARQRYFGEIDSPKGDKPINKNLIKIIDKDELRRQRVHFMDMKNKYQYDGSVNEEYINTIIFSTNKYLEIYCIDDEQNTVSSRQTIIRRLSPLVNSGRVEVHIVYFNTPIDTCIENIHKRDECLQYDENYVRRMVMMTPAANEGANSIIII